jgi:hypothetical protein
VSVVPEAPLQKSLRTCWVLVVGLLRGIARVRVVVGVGVLCVAVLLIILRLVSLVEAQKKTKSLLVLNRHTKYVHDKLVYMAN